MSNFFKSRFFIILVVVTVIILALSVYSTLNRQSASVASDAVGIIVTPVQRVFYGIGNSTGEFFGRFKSMTQYQKENEELKKQVSKLKKDTLLLDEMKRQNTRLKSLLDLKQRETRFELVAAEVTASDNASFYTTFTINKGTNAKISKNDAVITDDGLVGYVYEIGKTWAKVAAVIDPKTSVGGIIERTGDRTIVEGDLQLMEKGECKMSYISKGANIAVGDYIQTSGLGGIYPKGLIIGKVKGFTEDEQGLYHNAIVETAVDFERINEIMVIIN